MRGAAGAPSRLPLLPEDPVQLVRLQGAVQLGAGLLLALGRAPRSASAALAVTVVSSALTPYLYRATGDSDTDPDPEAGAAERAELLANVSLLGGLLIAAADTHGKPSLAHRTRRVAGHASGAVTHRAGAVSDRVGGAADTAVKSVTASVDAARKRLS
ncbi:putative oxidoreductase [Streptomyces sp. V2I9]|nr:putative oxidoreductase [Streptomyces sp. V2I9]